ncbi:hypothetical protein [Fulvivirga lutea]|uniref:LPP20 lipoprotein n=1 Tax=Fulvivirga lutea TaxID=2810512 RepID=A0A975A1K5_9BACT|nr:hypothetical protein [Fulvivirga lutea]QSE97916.1 hypothetical protein JR347_02175 [Fulvivirga lutea]
MRPIPYIIVLLFLSSLMQAQNIELKDVSGYAQKKFKKAPKKVYIAQFRVIYQLLYSQVEVAQGGSEIGGGYRGDAVAGLNMAIKGLSEEDIKATTNEIYANYLKELKNSGYEIISGEAAASTKEFEGYHLKEGGTLSEEQFRGLLTSIPDGFKYYVKETSDDGKKNKNKFNGYRLSADLDGAIVNTVTVVVPFVSDAESGASKGLSKAVGGVAKIVVKSDLRLENEAMGATGSFNTDVAKTYSSYYFAEKRVKPEAFTNLQLKKPVKIEGVMEEKKYKAAESADQDLWGSSYGALTKYNVSDKYLSKTHAVEVDPKVYKEKVSAAGSAYLKEALNTLNGFTN